MASTNNVNIKKSDVKTKPKGFHNHQKVKPVDQKIKITDQKNTPKETDGKNKTKKPLFKPYLSQEELQRGLKRGELLEGALRINQRNYEEAYIDNPDDPVDILIQGVPDRNRALHSDIVVVRVKDKQDWKECEKGEDENAKTESGAASVPNGLQKTAEVVAIIERKHSRVTVGQLRLMQDKNTNWALFSPNDARIPRLMIPAAESPQGFFARPQDFAQTLFIARITDWTETGVFARGSLCKSLGQAGEIEPETEGMLAQYSIDDTEFSEAIISCLPAIPPGEKWTIPEEEYRYRKDLRSECVFTIDPTTARDLDDALHIKQIEDGLYEVGVHIADVSYFVTPNTDLDESAAKRATSVYLVQKVIPMLPRLLCEELCSLNPGVDRLTFSVIWKIDDAGNIVDEWFGRSVICSCSKLTYEVAQGFIQEPDRNWTVDEVPPLFNGRGVSEIAAAVQLLQNLAVKLRKRRFDNGALRLDQPKIVFSLNKETGLPNGCGVYQKRDSNQLIEEFMLLANMAVARRIYKNYPDVSLLRKHPPPKQKVLTESVQLCRALGYNIDASSSGALNASLQGYNERTGDSAAVLAVLVQLMSKPMELAIYFSTGVHDDECGFRHYALSVPFYTHFTSPIRRYPDIMVHRLLAASLGYSQPPELSPKAVEKLAKHCNDRKSAAKSCSELSDELFFNIFVKNCGPLEEPGMVMGAMDHSFDVLVVRYGIIKRVYCDKLNLSEISFAKKKPEPPVLTLKWSSGHVQKIKILEKVSVVLASGSEQGKIMATILPPNATETS